MPSRPTLCRSARHGRGAGRQGVPIQRQTSHVIALGLYFYDPDGNPVEVFWDTGRRYPQPFNAPIDLSLPEEEILAQAEAAIPR